MKQGQTRRTMRRFPLCVAVLCVAAGLGCGYHAAGKAATLPAGIQAIAIPTFENRTQSYRVEQLLTQAVVHEFTSRTNYNIENSPSPATDATLRGAVTSTQISPLTYDSATGRISSALVTVTMQVSLVDKRGKVLFNNQAYSFREQYQVSREVSSFFEEESPAFDRLSRDFARTLVSNILENY